MITLISAKGGSAYGGKNQITQIKSSSEKSLPAGRQVCNLVFNLCNQRSLTEF